MIADIWWNDIKPYIPPKEAEKDQIETASQAEKEGEGLMKYTEDHTEYRYIHNLRELLKRLYFIASEEKAGNNNFHNEKIGIVHFFSSELERLASTPQGIEY
ncbi:unnamed protein product [Macrosiphum euphorbiae]|uniref:Uncharacterized protein n=1 Tax=Macrosiphum euphorbiae TaxID=13131 RepID=A0AAV0XVJ5_9HEMI|nr:unnamed protein product [Macrosiphum euphorbiae]